MEKIITNYVEDHLTDDVVDSFIRAAIHFIIDEELCSEEDIKKIEYRKNDKRLKEVDDCLSLAATYGYILYRSIALDIIDGDNYVEYCKLLLELSRAVRDYVTMKSDDEELICSFNKIKDKLGIDNRCDKFVLDKIGGKCTHVSWEATNEI